MKSPFFLDGSINVCHIFYLNQGYYLLSINKGFEIFESHYPIPPQFSNFPKLLIYYICKGHIFYGIGISFNKMYFMCNWILVSNVFKKTLKLWTSGMIEDTRMLKKLLKRNCIGKSRYLVQNLSIYWDLMNLNTYLDTSRSIEFWKNWI